MRFVFAEKFEFRTWIYTNTVDAEMEKKNRKFTSFFDKCMSCVLLALQKRCCGLFCFEISKHDLTSNFSACYFVSRL